MRSRGRIDGSHAQIVRELRQAGISVLSLANLGDGAPDILCGWQGMNLAFEIKDGNKPPSAKRLTPDEKLWHENWRGQVAVIETSEEALSIMRNTWKG